MSKVFLSYALRDENIARRLASRLAERDVYARWDFDLLRHGANWTEAVDQAVADSDGIIVLVGGEPSEEQRAEWRHALNATFQDESKPLVPILIEDAELPTWLSSRQALRLTPPDLDDRHWLAVLTTALRRRPPRT